jgi:magnesium-transporting ATPase (P-type)
VSVAIGDYSDAVFIFLVLLLNAVVGALQEWKAQTSAEALHRVIESTVTVRRDGGRAVLPGSALAPGDVVHLDSGARVPADIRLIHARDLMVDEALLTGESEAVKKQAGALLAAEAAVADRCNMLHAGTTVLSGRGVGVVVGTGARTEIGRIAASLAFGPAVPPPLLVRLEQMTRAIGVAVLIAVCVLGLVEFARGAGIADVFLLAVALAVSAIPEGLPVAITVALAVATTRMARRRVIVRLLPAVEGLGACTMIASDKTGTLTCNELTVKRLLPAGGPMLEVGGDGYAPDGGLASAGGDVDGDTAEAARRLAVAAALCNEASLRREGDRFAHSGDTVDVAFLVLAAKLGIDRAEALAQWPELSAVPYESRLRFAASFNRVDGTVCAFAKGAAETILPMCANADGAAVLEAAERLAADGYRVLAVAAGPVGGDPGDGGAQLSALRGLEFLGLVGLVDPIRPEVPEAIALCRRAGVGVVMITGDHPATALSIARQLGLADGPDDVVTGADPGLREGASPEETARAVGRARVFARVAPEQKTAIVQALRASGHFVAVTGDGVNDAPALHAANIGVAMGRGGTDIARGAADLILTDDNFASIVGGIEEGRIAYDNIRKVTYLLVSTGAAEIVVFFLAIAFGLPLPLLAVQLLWLNLVTNGVQHLALALERGERGVLDRPPRPPQQRIFDRRMIEQCLVSGGFMGAVAFAFFAACLSAGWQVDAARNATLLLMVLFENVHVFNCRSETRSAFAVPLRDNPMVMVAVFAAQGLHIAAMHMPGVGAVLRAEPVSLAAWAGVAAIALCLVAAMELYKRLRRPAAGRG